MSYILEALKKSQQERELGQVPTLDTAGIFSEDKEPVPVNHWGLLAVGLAALAVVIALFSVLRDPAQPRVEPTELKVPESKEHPSLARPIDQSVELRGTVSPPPDPLLFAPEAPLVEAPPPKHPIRAITSNPVETEGSAEEEFRLDEELDYPDPNLDPSLEWELQRQVEAEQFQFDDAEPQVWEPPQRASIPVDLVDDIEAFKQQVRREQGLPPPKSKTKFKPLKISGDPKKLRLTPEQQLQMPAYLMTAHVYDPDESKRFVLINALKYREGEETREGLRIERILSDGALLSYQGNPFYVSR